jgi:hypothetical protein
MMNKLLSIFLASRLIIAILIIAAVSIAVTRAEKEPRIMEGTIISKNIGLITVGSKNRPGQILTLSAGPETSLIAFHAGDRILIEYIENYIIRSITKQS